MRELVTIDGQNGDVWRLAANHRAILARLTARIVAAYVSGHAVDAVQLPTLVRIVHDALAASGAVPVQAAAKPAVPPGKSVHEDFLVCLEDGKRLKLLKRYLRATYDLSPDAYRKKWGLAPDYPMVAPAYAAKRSAFAKQIGLGRKVRRDAP